MQDIFQEFISFLLNSWKSLVFLFVFSYVLKETIGRVFLNIIRAITHLILDYSDKTISPFYSKDWESKITDRNYTKSVYMMYTYEALRFDITNEKIQNKYLKLIALYNSFLKSSFLFSILTFSELAPKLIKKTRKNLNYIHSQKYPTSWDYHSKRHNKIVKYKNQLKQIAFLFIHKFKFLFFKIYVYSKTIYVFNEKILITNFKKSIKKNEKNGVDKEFNYKLHIRNLAPIKDFELLLDLQWYCDCVAGENYDGEYKFYDLSSFWEGTYTGVYDAQELVDEFKKSDFLKGITFDVFVHEYYAEKELNKNYQVIESPNFSIDNRRRYSDLVDKDMMLRIDESILMGKEYLCPDYRKLQYKYCFITNVQIDEVIQFIEKLEGMVDIYISQGNLEESLKEHLNSKSIRTHKNYYYISRIEQLKNKIDNTFKYIDYTFIAFYFAISIFIEQNYFGHLEASIASLLEILKSYL